MRKVILIAALSGASLFAQLDAVHSEPNLEKRSELALLHANAAIDRARTLYKEGKQAQFEAAVQEIVDAVELSRTSLQQTGKKARRHPKHFKRAELKTRELVKRLDTLETDVGLEQRPVVTAAKKHVSAINDDFVVQIMTKKKS